jgi:hypothetical protein
MMRLMGVLCVLAVASSPAFVEAKPPKKAKPAAAKKGPAPKLTEQTKRAIGELAGKYKWGMNSQEVIALITADIKRNYGEKLKKVTAPLEQDQMRDEMNAEINKLSGSVIKFEGQRTSWDISIIDKDFAHKSNESMLVLWETDQRRFFFFENDRLWKQFIALNADRFEGKSFEEFAEMIAQRYGPPQKFMATDSKGREVLDHIEWPASGDYFLKAIDQIAMYGSYCLVLAQKSVMDTIEKRRQENNPARQTRSGADQVFKENPGGSKGDGNADVIDQITGKQSGKPSVENYDDTPTAVATPTGGDDKPEKVAKPKKGKGKPKKKK